MKTEQQIRDQLTECRGTMIMYSGSEYGTSQYEYYIEAKHKADILEWVLGEQN